MQKVMLIGAGKGGMTLIKKLHRTQMLQIVAVVDKNPQAPGMDLARSLGILTSTEWKPILSDQIDIVMEATGDDELAKELITVRSDNLIVIPGSIAMILSQLIEEKESLIETLEHKTYVQETIFNSTNDGMIGIDVEGCIFLFNKTAEKVTGMKRSEVFGKSIQEIMPKSGLPNVLTTRNIEVNQQLLLDNGVSIVTTRIPIMDEKGELHGALSIFKDITEVEQLAEEITNLKEIQTMLEATIQSSEEAISVVDEEGRGILINRAYTRMTGLTEEEVIGKPAEIDISEGESMHMKVLKTRRPFRGARLKVGPNKKDVIVNVAPIIVDGKLKGSVGVIHDVSEIQTLTNELNRARQIIRTLEAKYSFNDIIGESEEMKVAIDQAKLGAKTPATILLRGESGTGKELFAHAIHNASDRRFNKFIRVNCAAISESLLESELFGYEEGAFSGAKRGGKRGYFEEANNGSIFLDEIGELSAHMQAKLLRVLQEREIVRVGGTKAIPVNVRIIAATNVNLEKAMADGSFREDLYYRLNRYPISIPPLRLRKVDIPALCGYLIRKINQDYGRNVERISEEALNVFFRYQWPGNVRELENILGRAIIFMNHNETIIQKHHLPQLELELEQNNMKKINHFVNTNTARLSDLVDQFESDVIRNALEENGYNRTKTAQQLGISIRNLYYKIEKFNLAKNDMQ
ncbi:sigma-54-dependent Fis family transcriptional regulator [Bacillus sp. FJAT-47783]|uniref:sigma-54 interaction domain-containing protein n=1 Tax=Bacillus sp. FJAT-47783 TaxID=2922712 RepID=UPI001FADEA6A|nr:sigma-54-dependent Fis family transcriptional regulator [Bacillus sp. FJAT-47783]